MNQIIKSGTAGVTVSLCIMFTGILMVGIPFITAMDGMNGGYALFFVGFFVLLSGLISYVIFKKRKRILKRMLEGDIIARFVYDRPTWSKMVKEELNDLPGLKVMGLFLGGIFAVIGLVALIADEDLLLFFYIMMVLAVLFSCVGFLSYAVNKRRYLNCPPETIITHDGVYCMGTLYDWNGKTSVLDAVGFNPKQADMLVFCYRQLGGRPARMHRNMLTIPVPAGFEESAGLVVQFFNLPLPSGFTL